MFSNFYSCQVYFQVCAELKKIIIIELNEVLEFVSLDLVDTINNAVELKYLLVCYM